MAQLDRNGLTEQQYIDAYDIKTFDQPSVTVDIVLLTVSEHEPDSYRKLPKKSLQVLLIKRKEHPFIGKWALPGGFVRIDETIESAAYRELEEETNVEGIYLEQLYTYGDVKRDPRGRIISTAYMSLVNSDDIVAKAGTDAEEAKWFEVKYDIVKEDRIKTSSGFEENTYYTIHFTAEDECIETQVVVSRIYDGKKIAYRRQIREKGLLAFDHCLIVQQAIERIRGKLEHSDIIFHMMPRLFTLTDLQKAYELILDKPLLKANFRRKIAPMVEETDFKTSDAGHRPSKLYKFDPRWIDKK